MQISLVLGWNEASPYIHAALFKRGNTMAKSNDTPLQDILRGIRFGTTRLPDFQRGWVWDDEHIRELIASISNSYPIGAVMFLEYGGDGIRFKSRSFTNVPDNGNTPEILVLDGQQRLTSVYCAMFSKMPSIHAACYPVG